MLAIKFCITLICNWTINWIRGLKREINRTDNLHINNISNNTTTQQRKVGNRSKIRKYKSKPK